MTGRVLPFRRSPTTSAPQSETRIRVEAKEPDPTHVALRVLPTELEELEQLRPRTRADCVDGLRPCPFIACRHHLFLEVNESTGHVRFNFPGLEPGDLPVSRSCSLDIAALPATLNEVGEALGIVRERARQIEAVALEKLLWMTERR